MNIIAIKSLFSLKCLHTTPGPFKNIHFGLQSGKSYTGEGSGRFEKLEKPV